MRSESTCVCASPFRGYARLEAESESALLDLETYMPRDLPANVDLEARGKSHSRITLPVLFLS